MILFNQLIKLEFDEGVFIVLKLFKKAFWIVWEDITACPSISETHAAIAKHCESNGYSYHFIGDNEIKIEGIVHEISCIRSAFYRGRYVIKCREK